jgi:hypothetical protein
MPSVNFIDYFDSIKDEINLNTENDMTLAACLVILIIFIIIAVLLLLYFYFCSKKYHNCIIREKNITNTNVGQIEINLAKFKAFSSTLLDNQTKDKLPMPVETAEKEADNKSISVASFGDVFKENASIQTNK